jgi:uncharacterized protein YbbC (DUF1343 family)
MQNQKVLFGIDHFLQLAHKFKNLRFALVTNNAATTTDGILSRLALIKANLNLNKLFSPEHGLTTHGEDGAFQANIIDPVTKLPVISLYGDRLKPVEKDLANIDVVLFDIPDAGCRFYTYLWTMTYIMEACAEFHKPLFILDRPNPLTGNLDLSEGPMLDEIHCSSFIGRWSIPVRHSCTLGELASYFAATRIQNPDQQIVKVQNWKREQSVKEGNWLFNPPSPAIRDAETALLYPGMGLLEGINVNEGRGTELPFKVFGAPWIDALQIHEAYQNLQLSSVTGEPYTYRPTSGFYANEDCHGLLLTVTNVSLFHPVEAGIHLINLITSLYPEHCKERLYKTRANPNGDKHLDKLTGIYDSFQRIKNHEIIDTGCIRSAWKETMKPYLLYH